MTEPHSKSEARRLEVLADSTGCATPGDCVPSCSPECFKAKLRTVRINFGGLRKR